MRWILAAIVALAPLLPAVPAAAQDRRPSHCISLVQDTPGVTYVHKASFAAPLPEHTVRLRYIDHAMFLVRSPGGVSAVTDYSGFIGTADFAPDVATMNRAHRTHWTPDPDPRIAHVLRGWNPEGGPAEHYLELGDMVVRNVSTDIRSYGPGMGEDGNSIFVFEAAGLCIGHLGHLHHVPTDEQFAALGRIDVVMAPVDGGYTMDLASMIEVLQRLRSSVVIPMHWFGSYTLDRFLDGISEDFAVDRRDTHTLEVSLRSLPDRPTVVVLQPAFLNADE